MQLLAQTVVVQPEIVAVDTAEWVFGGFTLSVAARLISQAEALNTAMPGVR